MVVLHGQCAFLKLFGLAVCQYSCRTLGCEWVAGLEQAIGHSWPMPMHHCRQDHYQPSFDQLFDTREMLGTHCGVGDGKLFPLARFVLGGWWAELNAVRFVIKWPVSRIDESLVSFLTDLPLDVARRYIENGRSVRCLLADLTRALQMSSAFPYIVTQSSLGLEPVELITLNLAMTSSSRTI